MTAIDRIMGGLSVIALVGIALVATVCCAPRPQAREPEAAPVPFCFRLRFSFDGKSESALACASSAALCRNAQSRAVKYGGLMQATEVGQCRNE